ncbi:MAG TPA: hypothetical protein VN931_06640 [Fibrobacteria bacterium]|nr:hypothetical protein [Fibrobacteria bacterium]
MSVEPGSIYSLLPAVFRTRDAVQGGSLEALFQVLEEQFGIVRENLAQLRDDQFIETCAPWVIPYIGDLIGFDAVYTAPTASPDSRAEVANTIGYRRRKGTLVAMEQLTRDVSGRATIAVEEFRRLIQNLSLRDVRPHHDATANLRRGRDWEDIPGPFTRLNRTVEVRRVAPRNRQISAPDPTPLDVALHGGGRFSIPDVAVWMWRWKNWTISRAPAFDLGGGGWYFSGLGGPQRLFQAPVGESAAFFARLTTEIDVPEPIRRRRFHDDIAAFYPSSMQLFEDGNPVDACRIVCANLEAGENGRVCEVPSGKIGIDPHLGRIQYAADLARPRQLGVSYNYGAPAAMGGGPYDRSSSIVAPGSGTAGSSAGSWAGFFAVVGSATYPTLESAVAAWNLLPPGSSGTIILPDFESHAIDLTGPQAIQIPCQSSLLLAAAEVPADGSSVLWTNSWPVLRGDVEILAPPSPPGPDGLALPAGQLQISGIRLCGQMRILGDTVGVQVADSTLVPGLSLDRDGNAAHHGEASIAGTASGASLCLTRVATGPVTLPASASLRACASVVDAGSPYCPACAGPDFAGPGPSLHIEDSTVVGRVWVQTMPLASNTIFLARLGTRDPWKAPVWTQRVQTGCVRFCWLPWNSIVPRRYECIPPDTQSQPALEPKFITTRFGEPSYCLLSGDAPLAVWKGADNGSQMGVFLQIQETEAVANIQIRSLEYLPANLERGVFLVPSRPLLEKAPDAFRYGYGASSRRCRGGIVEDDLPAGIGIGLI